MEIKKSTIKYILESVPHWMSGQHRRMMPNNRNPRRENNNDSSCYHHPSPSRVPTIPHIARTLSGQSCYAISMLVRKYQCCVMACVYSAFTMQSMAIVIQSPLQTSSNIKYTKKENAMISTSLIDSKDTCDDGKWINLLVETPQNDGMKIANE